MDIVAMISYIYHGKSVIQVLSPRGKVWVCDSGLELNMPSRYSGGRALTNLFGVHYLKWDLIMHGQ